jgi:membrane protease YdiL (CAAX protease family)
MEHSSSKAPSNEVMKVYLLYLGIFWIVGYFPLILSSVGLFPEAFLTIFLIVGGASPTLAAVVTLSKMKRYGLNPSLVFNGFGRKTQIGQKIVVAIFFGIVIQVSATLIWILFSTTNVFDISRVEFQLLFAFMLSNLFMNIWEEIGWRGLLLPVFQEKKDALTSNIILGLIWGLWHIPVFFFGDPQMAIIYGNFLIFIVDTILISVIYGYLYNISNGNLWPVTLFHVTINSVGILLLEGWITPQLPYYYLIVLFIGAFVILIAFGKQNLSKSERIKWSNLVSDFLDRKQANEKREN